MPRTRKILESLSAFELLHGLFEAIQPLAVVPLCRHDAEMPQQIGFLTLVVMSGASAQLAQVRGFPAREAARRLGVPRSTLQRWLAQKPLENTL